MIMKAKALLFWMVMGVIPCLSFGQITHEGEGLDRMKVGRHVWKDQTGQIKAEVVHDDKGTVISYRTWDDKGLLIDEVKMDPKRKRQELPPLDLTFDTDGFGYLLIRGHAAEDAPMARQGERVGVYYEGSLQDGTVFDSNYGDKKPLRFKFKMGEVVPGFDRAVEMLKVGEEGYFWVPSTLAYGPNAIGKIPPFSDLLFRIKLVDLN